MSPVSPYSINSSCFIFVPSLQFMLIFLRVTQCLPFLQEILEIFLCFDQLRYWILGTPSKSHHQDDIPILRFGDPKLNLHLPLLLVDPIDNIHILNFSGTESAKKNIQQQIFSTLARGAAGFQGFQSGVPAIPVLELTGFSTPSAARRLISPPSAAKKQKAPGGHSY